MAYLAPGTGCVALAVDADGAGLRLSIFGDAERGWMFTIEDGTASIPLPTTLDPDGVMIAEHFAEAGTEEITLKADSECPEHTVTLRRWSDDTIEIVGYSSGNPCSTGSGRSLRSYKSDVRPLDDHDLAALREQLLNLSLTEYRYLEDPNGTRRIGVIIDDLPAESRWLAHGDHIDLYSYASVAVAVAQRQAREMEALRQRIEALETATCAERR